MITMILAGGSGTRLWPYSRQMMPKQFLNLGAKERSLIQQTFERIQPITKIQDIYVIGSHNHQLELTRQLQQLAPKYPVKNILLEPQGKNTAPAILWGLTKIAVEDYDQPVLILPADHLIQNTELFLSQVNSAVELAIEGKLVIFGIEPDRPETGYGYIQSGEPLSFGNKVQAFVEKPNFETAQEYLRAGNFSWNAGIFLGTTKTLIEEFKRYCPELFNQFFEQDSPHPKLQTTQGVQEIFAKIASDSFDYAILEKSNQVAVVTLDVGWNDLGSWESIYQVSPKDRSGNATRGDTILHDTKNSLVFSQHKLITCIGLEDVMIVETSDAILACNIKKTQDVKALVNHLQESNRKELLCHTTVQRPWGSYTVLFETPHNKLKSIMVLPGKRLSLQRHFHRSEHWVVTEGTAKVTIGENEFFLSENESTYIPKTTCHRLENPGRIPLEIIEVQQGEYLEEDDIQRFDDDFGRSE